MSKFKTFMKATGETLSALAEAQFAVKKVPVDNIAHAVNNIDWDNPHSSSVLYALSPEEVQKLREVEYILNRFPRK